MKPIAVTQELATALDATRRAVLPREKIPERTAWRDKRLMALAAHKRTQPD